MPEAPPSAAPAAPPTRGVILQPVDEPAVFGAMAEEIEALGYSDLWCTDSSLHARNAYAYLTLAATRTVRLGLGTAVTNPLTRHPAITAVAATTVDAGPGDDGSADARANDGAPEDVGSGDAAPDGGGRTRRATPR